MDCSGDKKEEKKTQSRVIKAEDFASGFDAMRRGAMQFIDGQFKKDMLECLEKEFKCKIDEKSWIKLQPLILSYNLALHQGYITKALEVLSLEAGQHLEIETTVENPSGIEPKSESVQSTQLESKAKTKVGKKAKKTLRKRTQTSPEDMDKMHT